MLLSGLHLFHIPTCNATFKMVYNSRKQTQCNSPKRIVASRGSDQVEVVAFDFAIMHS
jgi:hypothetical protein